MQVKNGKEIKHMVTVTVIVIAYNIEHLIGTCLKTIFAQDYSDYEVIVVDDGSTDGTLAAIKNACKGHEARIISKSNGGIVSARQAGLREAQGDFIAFVDGDDFLNEDMLSNMVTELQLDVTADIVVTRYYMEQPQENMIVTSVSRDEADSLLCPNGEDAYFLAIMSDNLDHHMFSKLYRREFLLAAGYLAYPHISMAEDLMTNAFLGCFKPCAIYGRSMNYYYRYNPCSMVRNGGHNLLEQVTTLAAMKTYMSQNGYEEKYPNLLPYQWFSYGAAYLFNSGISSEVKQVIINECRRNLLGQEENDVIRQSLLKPGYISVYRLIMQGGC